MTTKTIAIVLAFGAAAYVLTRKAGSGNTILGSLGLGGLFSGGITDIPTNGTNAGSTGWDGTPNTSTTADGPAYTPGVDNWLGGTLFD